MLKRRPSALASRIRKARIAAGLNLMQLGALATPTCPRRFSQIENGWSGDMGVRLLDATAKVLKVEFLWLATGRGPMRPDSAAAN